MHPHFLVLWPTESMPVMVIIYIFVHFSKTSDLVASCISCIMVVACKDNCPVACLVQKRIRMFFFFFFFFWILRGTSDWALAMSFVVACIGICIVACIGVCLVTCIGICIVACIGVCLVACRSSGLITRTLREARGAIGYLQHGRRI